MIYGGEASTRPEPTVGALRRHLFERRVRIKTTPMDISPVAHPLLRGPATLRPIPTISAPGRTLYECRANIRQIPSNRLPGIHLSRSRCHLKGAPHLLPAAASPFTDRCHDKTDTHFDGSAIHLLRRRAKLKKMPMNGVPAATHTQGDRND